MDTQRHLEPSYECMNAKIQDILINSMFLFQAKIELAYTQSNLRDILAVENFDSLTLTIILQKSIPK